jgi:hypothetical protein
MCAAACTFQMPSKWDGSSSPWQSAATLLTQDIHIPCRRYWFQGNMRQTSTNKCCPHMPLYLLHHSRLPTNPARWAHSTIEPQALHQAPLRVSQVCATNVAALGQPLRNTPWKEKKETAAVQNLGTISTISGILTIASPTQSHRRLHACAPHPLAFCKA